MEEDFIGRCMSIVTAVSVRTVTVRAMEYMCANLALRLKRRAAGDN